MRITWLSPYWEVRTNCSRPCLNQYEHAGAFFLSLLRPGLLVFSSPSPHFDFFLSFFQPVSLAFLLLILPFTVSRYLNLLRQSLLLNNAWLFRYRSLNCVCFGFQHLCLFEAPVHPNALRTTFASGYSPNFLGVLKAPDNQPLLVSVALQYAFHFVSSSDFACFFHSLQRGGLARLAPPS